MDGWNTIVSFRGTAYFQVLLLLVSGRVWLEDFWKTRVIQWLFLAPLNGGRWHIIPQLAVYTTYIPLIVLAFWGVICDLPPFRGTRNNLPVMEMDTKIRGPLGSSLRPLSFPGCKTASQMAVLAASRSDGEQTRVFLTTFFFFVCFFSWK